MKKISLLFFAFLMASGMMMAQRTITGSVVDDTGEGIIGANILAKGTTVGSITDFDGTFSLDVANEVSTLVISFTGYETQEIDITNQSNVEITLTEGSLLDEIVVTGYRNSTKPKSAVATQAVSAKTISNRPNASIVQTLQGQVAGLNISTASGQPGANSNINLRGVTSINGNTEPLFILDGVPVDEDSFRSLNPNEIERVDVLKDAGATAIYGNRGANGVIVITTKRGALGGGLQIEYTGIIGVSSLQGNDYDLLGAQQQLQLEADFGAGRGANISADSISRVVGTDWLDQFFIDPLTHNHNLSIRTGNANFGSYTNFGYTDQQGILVNSGLQRYSFRTNLNGKSNDSKFNYATNLTLNYSRNDEPNNIGGAGINRNFVLGALQSVPYISIDEYTDGEALLSPLSFANTPLFLEDLRQTFTRFENEIRSVGNISASYEIIPNLRISTNIGGDLREQSLVSAEAPNSFNALLFAEDGNTTPGFQFNQSTRVFSYNILNALNYDFEIGDGHSIGVGLYQEAFRAWFDDFGFRNNGLDPRTFAPGDGSGFVDDNADNDFFSNTVNANQLRAALLSYFGNLDYDYKSKYGFSATVRRDASFRFSDSNRWGTFFSFAGRWNLDQEQFLQDGPFDLLKLRASYGETGNQRIVDSGGFLNYFGGADLTQNFFGTGSGYGGANSLFLTQIANTSLRWETVKQFNVGVDFELLNSRLRGSADYYVKTTEDLFQDRPVSAINATNNLRANIGSLSNTGVDLQLNYNVLRSSNGLNVELFANANYNKQNVIDIPTPDGQIINGDFITREGSVLNEFFVYRYAGVNASNGNLLFFDIDGNLTENPSPDTDRVFTGLNVIPDWIGAFGFNADYKGIFLSAQFNYTVGVYRFDDDLAGFQDPTNIGQFRHSSDILRAWQNEGDITDIPSLTASNIALDGDSDRYLFNSDYVRLRFVQLGYTFPSKITEKIGLGGIKIFGNAENLITWTSWRGLEADAPLSRSSRDFPNPRIITGGVEIQF